MINEEIVREAVNIAIQGYGAMLIEADGDSSLALTLLQQYLLTDVKNMRREELSVMLAFAIRRLYNKRSDLVRFSKN